MTALGDLPRLTRTIRQLTIRQITSRAAMTARFQIYRLVPALVALQVRGDSRLREDGLGRLEGWLRRRYPDGPSEARVALGEQVLAGHFPFVGHDATLDGPPMDWRPGGQSRLWQYHLHYFDYLVALAQLSRDRRDPSFAERGWALVDDWLRTNPAGAIPAWEPYPTSVRVANWATAWALYPAAVAATPDREARVIAAIGAQVRFLSGHLEFHIGGNHLIKNARALVMAGRLLGGRESDRWSRRGHALLRLEIGRQVLSDGGHCERSPMYHASVLEDLLDCIALDAGLADLTDTARRMATWLEVMRHPDGGLASFNDTIAFPDPTAADVASYAGRVTGVPDPAAPAEGPGTPLPASGFYVLRAANSRMIVDCGDIGPPELAAHAHADTLGFELSWDGRRAIVDSGVAEYEPGALRRYVRSTRAHNTVVVDRTDQSEVWASHRAGRRARPLVARIESFTQGVRFVGGHDGYRRLGITHWRHIVSLAPAWIVVDELLGRGVHGYESFVHLHPKLTIRPTGTRVEIDSQGGDRLFELRPLGEASVSFEQGLYCAAWGSAEPNSVIRLARDGSGPTAFGYALVANGANVEISFTQNAFGITVVAAIEGTVIHVACDRAAAIVA